MKLKISILKFIVLVIIPIKSYSQIAITNINEIAKIKAGTTFFAMKDPTSPKALAYVDAIKKNWTLSKVECIKYTDVEKNIAINNSFVTIGANMTSSNSTMENTDTKIYLELWTTNGNFTYDPKKRKHFNQADKISLATIELFADFTAQNYPSSLYKMDYDANGHLENWSAGILGNYIQQLMVLLNKAEPRETKTTFFNKEDIKKLTSETLYVPDYVMIKFSKNADDESKIFETKEIFEGYNLKYKLLPLLELNDKILNNPTPIYYLLFIKNVNEKFITVTNSKTGEIVYSEYSSSPSNFKPSDMKDIQKAIQKK
ncbi:hypothetical protein QWY90_13460 [Flavobacterium paronense]|uniref:Uncharacterized protein n=1 Tax=Flavobacterium paronense TaxID=1392775 RepID=A0ABV5GEF6_9FLAO|nr:hypothetical protein [Flavobacterium paronense]MDN3678315.1 hypothetical protein [Flavobacterium paronense]